MIPDPPAGPVALQGPDDARAAGYAHLIDPVRHRDADRQAGVFVVEGIRAIRQVVDEGWPLESVMLSNARRLAEPALVRDVLATGACVYTADQDLFDRITGYHAHRGALALARRPAPRTVASVVAGCGLVLVVEGVNDHENVGALFRNAAAFGVGAVVLDPSTADPLYRRSVRVSVGHVLRVPFARAVPWPDAIEEVRAAGLRVAALTPRGEMTVDDLAGVVGERPGDGLGWAVTVGSEGPGLSEAVLAAADVRVRIPMAAGVDSLNVATAAAVVLHRLARL